MICQSNQFVRYCLLPNIDHWYSRPLSLW